MKLNKKGFTLVELLAVIVILLLISTIAISSINAAVERNKKKQNDAKIKVIESYAKLYYEERKNTYTGSTANIYTSELNLDENESIDANGNQFNGCVRVAGIGSDNITFTYDENC